MADGMSFQVITNVDNTNLFTEGIDRLLHRVLLVGVPQEKASEGRQGDEPNNAELAFIHTMGSPLRHIPARPFLEPAITEKGTSERIADYFKKAAESAVTGDFGGIDANLGRAGMIARNAVVAYIDDSSHFVPNAEITIARKGSDKPLIDTGSLRTSITYVIKKQ